MSAAVPFSVDRLPSRPAFEASPPAHLFHYTDLEGVKGIFTSRTLCASYRSTRPSTPQESRDLITQFNATFLLVAPVIKDHRFAEEREWRLVSNPVPFDHPGMIAVLKGNQASVKLTVKLTNESDAIDVLSQRNGFHISDIAISEIPYRRIAE